MLTAGSKLWVLSPVWFRVKLHVKDPRMLQEKKRYVAFWLERYAKREPGMSLSVVFDMSESGLGNVVRNCSPHPSPLLSLISSFSLSTSWEVFSIGLGHVHASFVKPNVISKFTVSLYLCITQGGVLVIITVDN